MNKIYKILRTILLKKCPECGLTMDKVCICQIKKNNNMRKQLTKTIVKDKADELIKVNGSTTNLQIKEALRKDGYWATQDDIREYMDELEVEEGYSVNNNGSFRTFSAAPEDDDDQSPGYGGLKINTSTATKTTTSTAIKPTTQLSIKASLIQPIDETEVDGSDWMAYSVMNNDILYYSSNYTRDQVRCAYRLVYPMDITSTRACRVK